MVAFRSWDDRHGDRSFIRIVSPPKDEGTGFLMKKPNLWMYVPRVERTMRIPPSMMLQSWMGSDFTNDDLMRESSQLDDYDHRLLGIDPKPEGAPGNAPTWWSTAPTRTLRWSGAASSPGSRPSTTTPLRQEFYDESGVRSCASSSSRDVREAQGRWFPHRWEMDPLEKPGHRTVIEIDEIHFDVKIPDGSSPPAT